MKNIINVIIAIVVYMPATTWSAISYASSNNEFTIANAVCEEITTDINNRANFTRTTCIVTKAQDKGGLAISLVSAQRVPAGEPFKLWMTTCVADVALELLNHDDMIVDTIAITDKELAEDKIYFVLSPSIAKDLQTQVSSKAISFDQFFDSIMASGKFITVKK